MLNVCKYVVCLIVAPMKEKHVHVPVCIDICMYVCMYVCIDTCTVVQRMYVAWERQVRIAPEDSIVTITHAYICTYTRPYVYIIYIYA